MKHLYKWVNQFADVFISKITSDTIEYETRDKITGALIEPPVAARFELDLVNRKVWFENRSMNYDEFVKAKAILA